MLTLCNFAQQSKAAFAAGERRISATAHSTTAHLKLAVGAELLRPVFAALAPSAAESALTAIQGYDDLLPQEQRAFEEAMTKMMKAESLHPAPPPASAPEAPAPGAAAEKEGAKKAKGAGATGSKQPPQGKVTKSKGKVCWKFAGAKCPVCTCIPVQPTACSTRSLRCSRAQVLRPLKLLCCVCYRCFRLAVLRHVAAGQRDGRCLLRAHAQGQHQDADQGRDLLVDAGLVRGTSCIE